MAGVDPRDRQLWIENLEAGLQAADEELEAVWERADKLAGLEDWGADAYHHVERARSHLERALEKLEEGTES